MADLRQAALEACPFCGDEPSFSGNASDWKDESRYVELSLGCCVSMTEQIGWRRARDMTHEAKTAELQNRLRLKWNTRAALEQQEQAEPVAYRFQSPATEGWLLGLEPPVSSRWEIEPLYTHPPRREWRGLTDDENNELSITMVKGHKSVNWLARTIEARLKELNHE